MKTVLLFLAMVCTPSALVLAWVFADSWLEDRAETKRRGEQDREVTAEWLALLAATETTPVFDRLACEQIEKAEGWTS